MATISFSCASALARHVKKKWGKADELVLDPILK